MFRWCHRATHLRVKGPRAVKYICIADKEPFLLAISLPWLVKGRGNEKIPALNYS